MINKIGIIEKLLTGEYQSPFSRKNIQLPIEEIVVTPSVLNYQFRHFKNFENKKNLIISGVKSFAPHISKPRWVTKLQKSLTKKN
jgi:hypothetical protein